MPWKYYLKICPNCASIICNSMWLKEGEYEKLSVPPVSPKKKIKCSICEKSHPDLEAYSAWYSSPKDESNKALIEKMLQYEIEVCRESLEKKMGAAITCEENPVATPFSIRLTENLDDLKSYLRHLINLEFAAHFLRDQIVFMNSKSILFQRGDIYRDAMNRRKEKKELEKGGASYANQIEELKKEFEKTKWDTVVLPKKIAAPKKPVLVRPETPVKPTEPILKTPSIFNKKKVLENNELLKKEYERSMAEYERKLQEQKLLKEKNKRLSEEYAKKLEEHKLKVEEEKAKAAEACMARKKESEEELKKRIEEIKARMEAGSSKSAEKNVRCEILNDGIEKCKKLLDKVCDAINKAMNKNVLYPEYRDLFALTSIYEYLNSERCYTLVGPDGAYNLYESERRSDICSTILRKLEDVNKKQAVLYRMAAQMYEKSELFETTCNKMLGCTAKSGSAGRIEKDNVPTEKSLKAYTDLCADQQEQIEQQIEEALKFISQ